MRQSANGVSLAETYIASSLVRAGIDFVFKLVLVMPFILALAALVVPRVVIASLWLLSDWFVGVFNTMFWPVVGFFVAPTTLLWYSVVQNWFGGEWGFVQTVVLVIAVIIDFSPSKAKRDK